MAAVVDQKEAAAKAGSQVDEQIAQATSRIRAHDLTFGGLVLLALVLVYATAMIVLDRYLVLPEWVRQVALLGFVGTLAGTAFITLVSPLRKRINPLYAAMQVERTIDDAKNSVTGYVDAQQKGNLNSTVKAALASRAAKSVAEADVNKAVDHRSLMYVGGVAAVFLLALVVLFFVFRPAQFASLVSRTFVPFSSTVIGNPHATHDREAGPGRADHYHGPIDHGRGPRRREGAERRRSRQSPPAHPAQPERPELRRTADGPRARGEQPRLGTPRPGLPRAERVLV